MKLGYGRFLTADVSASTRTQWSHTAYVWPLTLNFGHAPFNNVPEDLMKGLYHCNQSFFSWESVG